MNVHFSFAPNVLIFGMSTSLHKTLWFNLGHVTMLGMVYNLNGHSHYVELVK